MAEVTPVTLLAGGGDSDVLQHLLEQPEGAHLGVVTAQPEPLMRWNAGCPCCAPRGDIAHALRALLPRARRDEVRRVIIATTGSGDPGPVLATLLSDPVAAAAFRLDGIVVVIGPPQFTGSGTAEARVLPQVAMADRIVLAGSRGAEERLRARLRTINPAAPILATRDSAIDPAFILNAGLSGPAPDLQGWLPVNAFPVLGEGDPHDADGVASFCRVIREPLSSPAIHAWLERLVLMHGASIARMKAVLHVRDQPGPAAIHSVRHLLFPPIVLPAWSGDDTRQSRLALIVRDARCSDLRALLADLRETAAVQ